MGIKVAPPPPGPSFCQVVVTAFSLVSDSVLHAANAASKMSSLADQVNVLAVLSRF